MTSEELFEAVEAAERAERVKRGLPPTHVLDFAQFPFAYAPDALAEFKRIVTEQPNHPFLQACVHLAYGEIDAANDAMERFQQGEPADPKAAMRFGAFPIPPAIMDLPPVVGTYPEDTAYFLCCDGAYFRNFGIVLLRSIADRSPGMRVHMHLMNPDMSLMRFVESLPLKMSLTHETCAPSNKYYHAVRLVRFAEALEKNKGSLLMTDVDALAGGDISKVVDGALAMRVRAGRLAPWNQFSACFIRGDATSRAYFRRVAEIVKASPLWWGIDQYALYSAWTALKPSIELVGPKTASVIDSEPGIFWFTAGEAKKNLLTAPSAYAKLFQRYIRQ
ncbi:MAG: hypothetical protein AB7I36_03765 [Rhodospirillaceae bacterium]